MQQANGSLVIIDLQDSIVPMGGEQAYLPGECGQSFYLVGYCQCQDPMSR